MRGFQHALMVWAFHADGVQPPGGWSYADILDVAFRTCGAIILPYCEAEAAIKHWMGVTANLDQRVGSEVYLVTLDPGSGAERPLRAADLVRR